MSLYAQHALPAALQNRNHARTVQPASSAIPPTSEFPVLSFVWLQARTMKSPNKSHNQMQNSNGSGSTAALSRPFISGIEDFKIKAVAHWIFLPSTYCYPFWLANSIGFGMRKCQTETHPGLQGH